MRTRQIAFRCPHCLRIVERGPSRNRADDRETLTCPACDSIFKLSFEKGRWNGNVADDRVANALALEHDVDLPSAYSILEGIMTLEQARSISAEEKAASKRWVRSLAAAAVCILVAASFLLRFDVAAAPPPQPRILPASKPTVPESKEATVPLGGAVSVSEAVEFTIGPSGALAGVSGPDPGRALAAFCKHSSNVGRLSPLAVTEALPARAGERLGIVRDFTNVAVPKAVRIRQDPRTRRWLIGDGASQIVPAPASPSMSPADSTPL